MWVSDCLASGGPSEESVDAGNGVSAVSIIAGSSTTNVACTNCDGMVYPIRKQ